jgi:hypothetical protein
MWSVVDASLLAAHSASLALRWVRRNPFAAREGVRRGRQRGKKRKGVEMGRERGIEEGRRMEGGMICASLMFPRETLLLIEES